MLGLGRYRIRFPGQRTAALSFWEWERIRDILEVTEMPEKYRETVQDCLTAVKNGKTELTETQAETFFKILEEYEKDMELMGLIFGLVPGSRKGIQKDRKLLAKLRKAGNNGREDQTDAGIDPEAE